MNEFIEKLIGRLEELKELHKELIKDGLSVEYHSGCKELSEDAISIVNQLAEEYNNGWVFCSEKLPYYYENVLVCTENGGKTIAHLKHTPIEWVDMYANKIDGIVAWQYLPNPYKECER